jgi:hypothetical protein
MLSTEAVLALILQYYSGEEYSIYPWIPHKTYDHYLPNSNFIVPAETTYTCFSMLTFLIKMLMAECISYYNS